MFFIKVHYIRFKDAPASQLTTSVPVSIPTALYQEGPSLTHDAIYEEIYKGKLIKTETYRTLWKEELI